MTDFCPDGYLPTQEAIVRAAECWFSDKIAALESAAAPESQTKSENNFDAAVRAFAAQPSTPDAWRHGFSDIASHTVHRLRNFLHRGNLKAYYFGNDGCHSVSREFWATAQAHGVMESGTYWLFGGPTRWRDQRLHHSLFVKQSELDALLNKQPAEKPRLPQAKLPDLVAALRTLDHLPNREKQREALRNLPEFEQYRLTDDVLREAEKQAPRGPGRKRPVLDNKSR